jgi:hypothetical protein
MRTFLVVVGCSLAYPCAWVTAEEEIKFPSPDGRFALRIIQSEEDEYHPTVELIEKDSSKVIVTFNSASDTDLFDASDSVLVWSADSKRVAYGFRASPPGVREVERGARVYFWNGSGFDKVFLPENLPVPEIEVPKGKGGYEKPYGGGVKPLRWLKSGDLEMSSENEVMLAGKTYKGVLHFTISFDAQHHASVKNIGKTKTRVEQ